MAAAEPFVPGPGKTPPQVFLVAEFVELEYDGYKKKEVDLLHRCKTKKKSRQTDPVWDQTLKTCRLPVNRTRLKLTLHEFAVRSARKNSNGNGHPFLGRVVIDFCDVGLPFSGKDVDLKPLMDATGTKMITAALKATLCFRVAKKKEGCIRRMIGAVMRPPVEIDPHAKLALAMKKKVGGWENTESESAEEMYVRVRGRLHRFARSGVRRSGEQSM